MTLSRIQIDDLALRASRGGLATLPGATVLVTNAADGSTATVYAAETGSGTLANPQTVDAYGRYAGWVELGADYDVEVSYNGQVSSSRRVVGSVDSKSLVIQGPLTSADILALGQAAVRVFETDASGNVVAEWVKTDA